MTGDTSGEERSEERSKEGPNHMTNDIPQEEMSPWDEVPPYNCPLLGTPGAFHPGDLLYLAYRLKPI